ncbi:MAG: Hint domain-containing protein [Oceanicola sp.]|nr:Hint domain-containing protein [Oceanicola sp.]
MTQTFSNSGTFDGLDATIEVTLPDIASDTFEANVQLSQNGVSPIINVAFAIDRSGSAGDDTGVDFDGDGTDDTFLEAQVFALQEQLRTLENAGFEPSAINVTIVDYAGTANSFSTTLDNFDDLVNYAEGLSTGGITNYAAALTEIEDSFANTGAAATDTNIVYFYSDGFPFPSNQDYQTPLGALESAFDPTIFGVGFGPNSAEDDLAAIDSSGSAQIVQNLQDLQDLVDTPPPLPDVVSFEVFVNGELVETIPVGDPRVEVNPTGFTIPDLAVTDYASTITPDQAQDLDVQIGVQFSNGETLVVAGGITYLDGVVEGTTGDDTIDLGYTGDPEGDKVDNQDNLDQTAVGDALDNDVIKGFEGNDIIFAGAGDDIVEGGAGNDTIDGGAGNDRLFGGADRDTFVNTGSGDEVDGGEAGDDFDTLDLTGSGKYDIEFDAPGSENGTVRLLNDDGSPNGEFRFENIERIIPCFTPESLVETATGLRRAEDLRAGDRVLTRDNGFQEIRWACASPLTASEVSRRPHLRPVRIRAGALGGGLPERDMLVSPNHRMLISGPETALYFAEPEVLVAAKFLVNGTGVTRVEVGAVKYIHFMFDRHEMVRADGAWSESFQPGDYTLSAIDQDQRQEILALFPDLASVEGLEAYHAARLSLRRSEAQLLRA